MNTPTDRAIIPPTPLMPARIGLRPVLQEQPANQSELQQQSLEQ